MSLAGGIYRKFRSAGIHHQRTSTDHASTGLGFGIRASGYPLHQRHQPVRRHLRSGERRFQHRIFDDIPVDPIRGLQIIYEFHGSEYADAAVREKHFLRPLLHLPGVHGRRIQAAGAGEGCRHHVLLIQPGLPLRGRVSENRNLDRSVVLGDLRRDTGRIMEDFHHEKESSQRRLHPSAS